MLVSRAETPRPQDQRRGVRAQSPADDPRDRHAIMAPAKAQRVTWGVGSPPSHDRERRAETGTAGNAQQRGSARGCETPPGTAAATRDGPASSRARDRARTPE